MPEYDKFGMVIEETLNREDPWRCRAAIARSFATIAPHLRSNDVLVVFDLLLSGGALGDRSSEVRSQMLSVSSYPPFISAPHTDTCLEGC